MTEKNKKLVNDVAEEVTKRMSAVIESFQSQLSEVAEQVSTNTEKIDENRKVIAQIID